MNTNARMYIAIENAKANGCDERQVRVEMVGSALADSALFMQWVNADTRQTFTRWCGLLPAQE